MTTSAKRRAASNRSGRFASTTAKVLVVLMAIETYVIAFPVGVLAVISVDGPLSILSAAAALTTFGGVVALGWWVMSAASPALVRRRATSFFVLWLLFNATGVGLSFTALDGPSLITG